MSVALAISVGVAIGYALAVTPIILLFGVVVMAGLAERYHPVEPGGE